MRAAEPAVAVATVATVAASPVAAVVVAQQPSNNGQVVEASVLSTESNKRSRFALSGRSISDATLSSNDPALQSRMAKLLKEVCPTALVSNVPPCPPSATCAHRLRIGLSQVDTLAKRDTPQQLAPPESMQLERLISTNREQQAEIARLNQAAAQREALVAQLQVLLTQSRIQVQQAHQSQQQAVQAAQAERDNLVAQHQLVLQQSQQSHTVQHQQVQQQLQQGLAAASQSQVAQQVVVGRLASFLTQTHHWLHCLSQRCASQSVELPIECASALNLLQSVSSVTAALAADGANTVPAAEPARPPLTAPAAQMAIPMPMPLAPAVAPPATAASAHASHLAARSSAEAADPASSSLSSGLEILAQASQVDDTAGAPAGEAAGPSRAPARAAAGACGGVSGALPVAPSSVAPAMTATYAAMPSLAESVAFAPMASSSGSSTTSSIWPDGAAAGSAHASFLAGVENGNPALSPSTFCSLLSSPDLHQLMSPQMTAQMTPSAWAARPTAEALAGAGGRAAEAAAAMPPPPDAGKAGFSQFKPTKSRLASSTMQI